MTEGKDFAKTWRERMAERMAVLGWTQIRMAEEMDVSQGTINHWLSGLREPNLMTLERLSRALKMTPAELITGVSREKAQIVENMTLEQLRTAYTLMVMMDRKEQNSDSRVGGGENQYNQRVS